jgi:hypothetical protein
VKGSLASTCRAMVHSAAMRRRRRWWMERCGNPNRSLRDNLSRVGSVLERAAVAPSYETLGGNGLERATTRASPLKPETVGTTTVSRSVASHATNDPSCCEYLLPMPTQENPKIIQLAVVSSSPQIRLVALDEDGRIWATDGRNLSSPMWSPVPGPSRRKRPSRNHERRVALAVREL